MTIDRHHLLECILWPKEDGTYRKIVNTQDRLRELGIYNDYKLVIEIDKSTHQKMHREFEKGTGYERSGEKAPMYGRRGDNHPAYGIRGENHPKWKGNDAKPAAKYYRALNEYRNNPTEENLAALEEARLRRNEDRRFRKANA